MGIATLLIMWRPIGRRLLTTSRLQWQTASKDIINDIKGKSSCPMGTKLNLGIWKDTKRDPVAKADNEYPEWLWQIIPSGNANSDVVAMDSLVKRSKDLRKSRRNQIKQNNYLSKLK